MTETRNLYITASEDGIRLDFDLIMDLPIFNYISISIIDDVVGGFYKYSETDEIHIKTKSLKFKSEHDNDKIMSHFKYNTNMFATREQLIYDINRAIIAIKYMMKSLEKNKKFANVSFMPFLGSNKFALKVMSIVSKNKLGCVISSLLHDIIPETNKTTNAIESYMIDELENIKQTNDIYKRTANEIRGDYREYKEAIDKRELALNTKLASRVAEMGEAKLKQHIPDIIGKATEAVVLDFKNRFYVYFGEVFRDFESTIKHTIEDLVRKEVAKQIPK